MDDPTKDTIPRSAVEYCLRKETVSTNPEKYKTHEKFIDYMNDPGISEFGHWMHSNGFNCALTAISVDLKKIPSVTPSAQPVEDVRAMCGECDAWNQYKNPQTGWIPCSTALPEYDGEYLVTKKSFGWNCKEYIETDIARYEKKDGWHKADTVLAWCELPTPYREGGQDGKN